MSRIDGYLQAPLVAIKQTISRHAAPELLKRIREHFGTEVATLPIVEESFAESERPNLQIALDAYVAEAERSSTLLGVSSEEAGHTGIRLAELMTAPRAGRFGTSAPEIGPVQYANFPVGHGKVLACLQCGLHLVREGDRRLAILVSGKPDYGYGDRSVKVEVAGRSRDEAEACLAAIRTLTRRKNVYRGHVISLEMSDRRALNVHFHHLPAIERDDVVLPPGLLERIERHTVRFSQHRAKLRASGRHLKRGMLLHGPPGTGKTLTAMYLARQMADRTTILLTGRGLALLEESCAMARVLEPATVIVEDVDLVATERKGQSTGCNAILFELLNQMDGLAGDVDVLFLLTTNRPETLEPALASRPGRVDLAVEVPLPDAEARRRLFAVHGAGLDLRLSAIDTWIERTHGASGAFIRELLRKATLIAADEGGELAIDDHHLDEALRELVLQGGHLTRSLLGMSSREPGPQC